MKNLMFLAVALFVTANAQAQNGEGCISKIGHAENWKILEPSRLRCLNKNSEFAMGLSALCDKDQADLSDEYKQYISYKEKYKKAVHNSKVEQTNTPSDKSLAILDDAKKEWEVRGFRSQIEGYRNALFVAEFVCSAGN